jgi:hypothetical protein
MKPANSIQKSKSHVLEVLTLLTVILGLLFWKCFLPGYVHFSNDGPLGQQNAAWRQLPAGFTGCWYDLNDIGSGVGTVAPSIDTLIFWVLGPVGYSKFVAPIALLILGFGAWAFFRQLRLSRLAAILGALAATLTSTFFSDACWGTAPHQIAFGMDFFALALIVSSSGARSWLVRWTRLALAGFAVGLNVVEAADIGAIFSLFVAAFVLFQSFMEEGTTAKKIGRGIARVTIIAAFAAYFAAQAIVALVGANIQGIAGVQPNAEAMAARWDWATQWSLPKVEAFGIVVPGLFGYRMDTPEGGNYWGGVGRDPSWDRYLANGQQGSPQGFQRFCGTGNYAGILVILVASWAIAQSLRRQNSVFSDTHRRFLWFWTAVLIVSLLLAFGRFSPFAPLYRLIYFLPYLHLSSIRNPIKFLFIFSWAIVIIFAYGIHALSRRYLETPATGAASPLSQFKTWRAKARGFDRNWTSACIVVLIGSVLAWLIYALQKPKLIAYLQTVGFSDENMANQIATFSVGQFGWFVLFFVLAAVLLALILSGALAGHRARWAGILLGALLVTDLGRADLPWIVFWNYPQKYASNPIVDILRDKPYEHRVAMLQSHSPEHLPFYDDQFEGLYNIEWSQQLFTYYNIQSLDIIQMSRMPEDLAAYRGALTPLGTPDQAYLIARRWELTNTRYLLGPAGFLDALNTELDPAKRRFRIAARFDVQPKPGIDQVTSYEQLTAVPNANGACALFEFTGALPRAKLYSQWQVCTGNPAELQQWAKARQQRLPGGMGDAIASLGTTDLATLRTLASTNFDPWKTVLVSTPPPTSPAPSTTKENSGTVEFKSYSPADIRLSAQADAPVVLLLNDKFDPNWHVLVDGQPAPLLRCNFIMRGVYLPQGDHSIEFKFSLPMGPLYVSLSAIGVGILLSGFLVFSTRRTPAS